MRYASIQLYYLADPQNGHISIQLYYPVSIFIVQYPTLFREYNHNIVFSQLFHGYALCQVARFVDIATASGGNVISQKLQRNNRKQGKEGLKCLREIQDILYL